MTYQEFRKTYAYAVRTWPETVDVWPLMKTEIGTCEQVHYEKAGSRWKEVRRTTETVSGEYYMNTVDAVPFFRRLGGSERVTTCYTRYGLIPVEISSISPDKAQKTVRKFNFIRERKGA